MAAKWLPFEDARRIVAAKGFQKRADYKQWSDRPGNIPSSPDTAYAKEWAGWGYWLGTGPIITPKPGTQVPILPFEEAKVVARKVIADLGITNKEGWVRWSKTEARPPEIPADPSKTYKGKGWIGWPDWLGRKPGRATGKEEVRSFLDARDFARSLNLPSSRDWYRWAATPARPSDIPYSPDTRYRDEGWIGWGDFLGIHSRSRWTHLGIVAFLESLKPIIHTLSEFDLYLILSRNGMLRSDIRLRNAKLLRGLVRLKKPEDIDKAKNDVAHEALQRNTTKTENDDTKESEEVDVGRLQELNNSQLLPLHVLEDLRTVDAVVEARITDDPEALEFMVNERVAALWTKAIEDGINAALAAIPAAGGPYLSSIRDRFGTEINAAVSMPVPAGYDFRDNKGHRHEPNLMQRLTAFRLLTDRRLGNWSGVGAGKTVSAILSAGVLDAKLTVIVAANSTLKDWHKVIFQVFPEGANGPHVHRGNPLEFRPQPAVRNFLVVNYESFQQDWSEEFVRGLASGQRIDFLVLDEVQFVRQRFEGEPRMRRRLLESLIAESIKNNEELRILAMSATPVVNNLREAVKLVELIHPEQDFSEVPVNPSVANAARVHFLLRKHGIRWVPDYEKKHGLQQARVMPIVDGAYLFPKLCGVRPRDVLRLEQTLLEAKLEELGKWLRRGTLVFTYYVEGIVDKLLKKVEECGLRAAQFTGSSKIDLEEFGEKFKKNEVDVLIGSLPVGTGVDGLQHHLDRLIFVTLPWSNAEYQQIVGRLYRQGRQPGTVEIIIPLVMLREEKAGAWSWDDLRLRLIEYKRTLADAAVDGLIPTGGLPSREVMQQKSLEALRVWASKVEMGIQ